MEDLFSKNNTFSNLPILHCNTHPNNFVVKGCCEPNCRKRTLLCVKCLQEDGHIEHSSQVIDLPQFLQFFSKYLEKSSALNKALCKQFLTIKDNADLFKALNNSAQHLKRFQDNINTQKYEIAQTLTNLYVHLELECQKAKDILFQKLDQLQQQYNDQFKQFQMQFSTSFMLGQSYYYSNPSILNNKLAQLGEKANQFLIQFKNQNDQSRSFEELKQTSQFLSVAISSPFYQESSDLEAFAIQTGDNIKQFLLQKLKTPIRNISPVLNRQQDQQKQIFTNPSIPQPLMVVKQISQPAQVFLPQNLQGIQIMNGGTLASVVGSLPQGNFLQFKPLKKYTLDFPVASVLPLNQNQFILSSIQDGKLYFFERDLKKSNVLEGHQNCIIILEKLDTYRKGYISFVSAALDGSLYVWQLNQQNNSIEKVAKYQFGLTAIQCVLDIGNGGGLIFVDGDGKIGYINPYSKSQDYPLSGRINGKQIRLALVKANDTFVSYAIGQDGGMLWKLTEQGGRRDILPLLSKPIPSTAQLTIHPSYPNVAILVSTIGLVFFDLDGRGTEEKGNPGGEFELLTVDFPLENILYIVSLPIGHGVPLQFRIEKKIAAKFDVKFQDIKFDSLPIVDQMSRPRIRLFKEGEKLFVIISDPKHRELLIYEVLRN